MIESPHDESEMVPRTKIVIVNPYYTPRTVHKSRRLVDHNFDICQVTSIPPENAQIQAVTTPFIQTKFTKIWMFHDPHRMMLANSLAWMRHFKPDVIAVERDTDSVMALQTGIARNLFAPSAKLVFHSWQNIPRNLSVPARLIARATLRMADLILCANEAGKDVLREWGYQGVIRKQIWIGVDQERFFPTDSATLRKELQLTDCFVVGFIGRLVESKGVKDLIAAMALLPANVHCIVLGKGELEQSLTASVEQLDIAHRIHFLGYVPNEKLPKYLSLMDALVLPSKTTPQWAEQFGRVIIEAMACQTPVIGSNSGAIPEVIGDAGIIFSEGNVDELVLAINQLINSRDLRETLIAAGSQLVQDRYAQATVVNNLAHCYRSLAMGKL